LPRLQYRVSDPQSQRTNTILQTRTNKKWLTPFFVFGRTCAPIQPQGFDRNNTIVGKFCGKAATATNKQFGTMAGVARRKNTDYQ